nr:MAG TPA: DNA N-6-adenine-methyltransferase [Caudoviricetes sp.]
MLLRLQFLEGSKRYLKLFKTDPPKYVYLFVKRQKCFKNGISEPVGGSAVAYAWFVWLKGSKTEPILRWLN